MKNVSAVALVGIILVCSVGGCDGLDILIFSGDSRLDIEMFNDSGFRVHMLKPGEGRAPSNGVDAGQGRVTDMVVEASDNLTFRAENDAGFSASVTCTVADTIGDTASATVTFSGTALWCGGALQ